MPSPTTSDNLSPTGEQAVANSLVAKLNQVIRDHYPPGEVHFMEVIHACKSIAYAYTRVLLYPDQRWPDA